MVSIHADAAADVSIENIHRCAFSPSGNFAEGHDHGGLNWGIADVDADADIDVNVDADTDINACQGQCHINKLFHSPVHFGPFDWAYDGKSSLQVPIMASQFKVGWSLCYTYHQNHVTHNLDSHHHHHHHHLDHHHHHHDQE